MENRSVVRKAVTALIVFSGAGVLSSCATSRLSNTWMDTSYQGGPMTNVLVIAVKRTASIRGVWENAFAAGLASHGVQVTTSYSLFPNAVPDTTQVKEVAEKNGYDGIITISGLPKETLAHFQPYDIHRGWLHAYFGYWSGIYQPGYVEISTIVRQEVNVSTTKDEGYVIWTGTGEVIDPSSFKQVNHEIINLILPELTKNGIIPPEKN